MFCFFQTHVSLTDIPRAVLGKLIWFLMITFYSFSRFENTYPGVRCDIPAHAYQSGFSPNTQWTEEFAQGAEIRDYWQSVAKKYDVYKYLRQKQRVEKVEWLPEDGKWKVTLEDLNSNQVRNSQWSFCSRAHQALIGL